MSELIVDPQDGTPPLALRWPDGYAIQRGPLGLGLPPRKLIERQRVDGHGTDITGTQIGPRDVTIPLDVYARTRAEFLTRRRRLQVICGRSSHARPLRLTYIAEDGSSEWIDGVYVGGLEGDDNNAGEDHSELFAVTLRAGSPYWRAPELTESWALVQPARRNWFPLLGKSPQSSLVGDRRDVLIEGDVEVRPAWLVQGPGSRLTIANHTAGWRVEIDHDIPDTGPSSLITVTTAFGAQAVRDGHNVNLFSSITNGASGGWEMGPLLPGINDIEVLLEDSGEDSDVSFTYNPLLLAV